MNALEDLANKFVHLDGDADFIGKEALLAIREAGVKRKGVGLLFEDDTPRLEWIWDLIDGNGNPGDVRWAAHSFALNRCIGIALVDVSVEVGDIVSVIHPQGTTKAEVTNVPFVEKS
jgi:glycine cleavage system aminomethyltransferase T